MNDPSQNRESEAQTLHEVLERLERDGFVGHFGARGGGRVRCFACGCDFAPSEAEVESIRRLEGASDPADMLAVLPLRCPRCVTAGTLVLGYGPEAALEDSEVLAALPPAAHPPLPWTPASRGFDRSSVMPGAPCRIAAEPVPDQPTGCGVRSVPSPRHAVVSRPG